MDAPGRRGEEDRDQGGEGKKEQAVKTLPADGTDGELNVSALSV
jgi:hypothetical protein